MTGTALPARTPAVGAIAPWWHTAVLIGIMIAIAIRGAMFQAVPHDAAPQPHNAMPLYVSLVISELLLVYAVARGTRRSGMTLRDLAGGRWRGPRDIAVDVVRGVALWALIVAGAGAWERWGSLGEHARSINPLLPQGPLEIMTWIVLSAVGGVAEEIVFRGYFQRQFLALTQNHWAALGLQAILFGVSHGYQGIEACIRITLIGVAFGLVAMRYRSLRPGMIAHVWTDIWSGVLRAS